MHSMQAGYLEKAQKYTDKALMQLEKLKSKCHLGGDPTQSHVHAQGGQGNPYLLALKPPESGGFVHTLYFMHLRLHMVLVLL